jgi:hypothetical protein
MSVNQSNRKSTFSPWSRFSASFLASGSLVAQALLSTCAIETSLKNTKAPGARGA